MNTKQVDIAAQIKRGMALAFFASAYADQADECGQPLCGEIMDQLPAPIDPAALHAADTLAADVARANGMPVADLFAMLEEADRGDYQDRELTADLFGHYLAMQAMGHGVGLESFGNKACDLIRVPYCEFGSYSLQTDYFQPNEADQ